MGYIRSIVTSAAFGMVMAASAPDASAQTVNELFDANNVQDIQLSINERDLTELRERYREDLYFPADLVWRGIRVQNVGIRSRGLASRSATKIGLKLAFSHYVSGQRFLGLESLLLDNLVTDPSMIREVLAMKLFTAVGEPSLRESFARVYINRVYQGLYVLVEPVNDDFLERTWNDRDGYLFERHFMWSFYGQDLGDDEAVWRQVFEPRTHQQSAGTVLYTPIRNLFHEVNQPLDGAWRASVERYIDLDQFVSHVAIETFLAEADGVLGYAGMANFYLYRPASSTRHRLIVWDKDHAFWSLDSAIFPRSDDNILFSRALTFADLRTRFLQMLERCAQSVSSGWLDAAITDISALVADAARQDPLKPYSDEDRTSAVAFLHTFARERPGLVLRAVAHARGEP